MSSISDKETSDRPNPYLRKEFIDTLTHDLRTPLVSGVQILELLTSGACGPIQEDALRLINVLKDEQEKALQMLTSLIEIYRLGTGATKLSVAPINISEILAGAIFIFKKEFEEKNIKVVNNCVTPCQTLIDLKWTSKALISLMRNCLAHTEPGSTITTAIKNQNNVCNLTLEFSSFSAKEELQAIANEYKPSYSFKLLMPPVRLDLHLCLDIIAQQRGRISFAGEAPSQLTIELNLPLAQ